jgi:polyribonucleotide 5'-hydroxyl-kinase
VLAVSHAATPDQILNANVAGFVVVKDVDTARGTVTLTTPSGGPLPGRYLLIGGMRTSLD